MAMYPPQQDPEPGNRFLRHRGDVLEFSLALPSPAAGRAWLRTDLGRAEIRRREIIERVEAGRPVLARNWHDVPMRETAPGHFSVTVPLTDVGCFEAKACFLPEGADAPVWPEGPNVAIKVEPADYASSCSIYTAFVRQFGPNRDSRRSEERDGAAARALEAGGYAVIPRSGTFRDLIRELDLIVDRMHFRIVQLLPIHPTPTVYARMGRFGSPFAVLDFMDVEPSLAEFDRRTTPLDQFRELADAIHARRARLFIDIPINHTGWASWLQIHHPDWFARNEDRSFQSPGAWGVTWEDLSKLDYRHHPLWIYMADVFLFWCSQGVDGFRCDAGYMIPAPVWQYIVAKVRMQYPDTIFMLEGLGGSAEATEALLADANLDWAYSELFQIYDQPQVDAYLPGCLRMSSTRGTLVHFAETHDNDRLAARSPAYARFRTALAALCSQSGAFGITNGVEWFAAEKIAVHDANSLNWSAPENQVEHMARLNAILDSHPSFRAGTELRLIHTGSYNTIALQRTRADGSPPLLVLANFNDSRPSLVVWPLERFDPGAGSFIDLVSGQPVALDRYETTAGCLLPALTAICLTPDAADLPPMEAARARRAADPPACVAAVLRAKALEVLTWYHGEGAPLASPDAGQIAALAEDPRAWCALVSGRPWPEVVTWTWPQDLQRVVMLPPGHFLLVRAPSPFVADLRAGDTVLRHEQSVPDPHGMHFALAFPAAAPAEAQECTLALRLYDGGRTRRETGPILRLPAGREPLARLTFTPGQAEQGGVYALCANGRGAMAQARACWGELHSQYDALLAANLDPRYPVDRHVMLTRCRAWMVHRGYSQELSRDCLRQFRADGQGMRWHFYVPSGMGRSVCLDVHLRMIPDENRIAIDFHRRPAGTDPDALPDGVLHRLILRPDVEDRSCHATTKAYMGPEAAWPSAVRPLPDGFVFAPAPDRRLSVTLSEGAFTFAPEWKYMVPHPFEMDRGLNGSTDLFSPGILTASLRGGQTLTLMASVDDGSTPPPLATAPQPLAASPAAQEDLREALRRAMRQFIVRRDPSLTVIAGYPWFLDWGRDTLIFLRGMIAAGWLAEAREILAQFGAFEQQGTLPNMIRGSDVSNRDTSDSPLWFLTACADFLRAEGSTALLDYPCGGRPLREVLGSIARSYVAGTPNGIAVDAQSGLVFSPSHFTWMDTNFPAGTPREGYPVDIQALWFAAVNLMAQIEPQGPWAELGDKVRRSMAAYFISEGGFLCDCLHARRGQPAREASPDDALRPNQLLAITLGAVTDKTLCRAILTACEELLVPGAIRSLADRPVNYPLPVAHHGALLNDPSRPYWGQYRGDEDTRRKPAYHNGTAWTWQFPSYVEALLLTYGTGARESAQSLLSSSLQLVDRGCAGHVPEIVDGSAPHTQRGCGAQAWGASELFRVLELLSFPARPQGG